jgi:hypothetical protein
MIDLYCERTSFALLAEPLNLWTNLAFIVSAIAIAHCCYHKKAQGLYWGLPLLLTAIGIGSFAFHLYPVTITLLMDVVPIMLFSLLSIFIAQQQLLGMSIARNMLLLLGFISFSIGMEWGPSTTFLNGSEGYLPNWLYLGALAIALQRLKRPGRHYFLIAWCLFTVSLMLRSLDMAWCASWPYGTHFSWHLLNALGLWCIARGILCAINTAQDQSV